MAYRPTTDSQWQEMIDLLAEYGGLGSPRASLVYYTNYFLPFPLKMSVGAN